ncbi:hypothetical protein PHLGIDRAFT_20361 [Phlebiopsis gigantea 11061_1 CR5-6]|uniref:Uncharacterized protein n=1 Tax=Phlebiopsis gigantea (strain 11061_1 CR5-6) TaxID=745531 RepID=A0A0C3S160_PHLG1|nr:hypothetical protein PHLGIDRAFT_20361 [Phlebiopsis gigantea 11061_1 CR5-6]
MSVCGTRRLERSSLFSMDAPGFCKRRRGGDLQKDFAANGQVHEMIVLSRSSGTKARNGKKMEQMASPPVSLCSLPVVSWTPPGRPSAPLASIGGGR